MNVDVEVFLAAVIHEYGGEIEVPYSTLVGDTLHNKAIALDLINDGATVRLSLISTEVINESEL